MPITWYTHNWETLSKKKLYEALTLRSMVFVVEQNCVYQDLDLKDESAIHILGYKKNLLVAYARVLFNTKHASIGRVVIHPMFRGIGYGKRIIQKSIEQIPGNTPVHISAQEHLKGFYESLGFLQTASGYLEDGIPHIPMVTIANHSNA
ncbi:MAG: GNAT family N-acetyltransferase [Flavobacteriaceae bacterium]|nr:GNAT family N-acetyltransferase [Flavobacteriaceae bacterium]|tara:strand:+ start:8874 stop:9320 length:447 start_codon:yes stop_codon:yes gene_type:complete